jgi:23S rRNA (cytidine1920-2'-O)/16S rRNA (cytidine1409-2'-O)-methyltransferase
MAGQVQSKGRVLDKPGMPIDSATELQVAQQPRYVSRGGDKLASVADELHLDFGGRVVLDVGSSTGGFTDYALQHGASKVYCVDVGNAQLAYKLRQDAGVVVMERTDIRNVVPPMLDPRPNLAVVDLSFISLSKILPKVAELLRPEGPIIALAKPQFETDKPTADKFRGVISDEKIRLQILADFEEAVKEQFEIIVAADSGVPGAHGNRERFYLLQLKR